MSQYSENHHQENTNGDSEAAQDVDDAVQVERDKKLIKNHPLFILLEMLFEKCELATRGDDALSSHAFDEELQEFVRRREYEMTPILTNDNEIDNLMIKAIQVLRIHLLELEKVNELCKDFCHRYITCLKSKMHSENLLRSDSSVFTDVPTNIQGQLASTPNANVTVNQQGEIVLHGAFQSGGGTEVHSSETVVNGSTPLSQVGVAAPPPQMTPAHMFHLSHGMDDSSSRKSKRGVLPKQATEILRSWLFSHIVHPYPTEDEKRSLANQTNLTLLQVNNWFINARRRILQPMLDASNPNANVGKAKKSKPPASRAQGRYWPQPNEDESMSPSHYVEVDLEGRISPPPGIHIHSMRSEAT